MITDVTAVFCILALLVPGAVLVRAELKARRARQGHLAWWETHRAKQANDYDIQPARDRANKRKTSC